MEPLTLVLYVVVVPALLAAVTAMVVGFAGRRLGIGGAGQAAVALALGAGALAAQFAVAWPHFPPIEVTDRIPWLVGVAMLLGLLESTHPTPAWARWENRLLLVVLVLGLILEPVHRTEWPSRHVLAVEGALVLGMLYGWMNLERLAASRSTAVLGPAILAVGASTAVALLLGHNLVLFRIAGGLTAALGAAWVLSWWLPDASLSRGGVTVLVATVAALLIEGHVYSYPGFPLASAILLAVSPLAAWPAFVGPARRLASWQSALLAAVLCLLPAAIAVGLALSASPGEYE
jgi:hypothetical protein